MFVSLLRLTIRRQTSAIIMKQSTMTSFFGKRPAPKNEVVDSHENGSRKMSKTSRSPSPTVEKTKKTLTKENEKRSPSPDEKPSKKSTSEKSSTKKKTLTKDKRSPSPVEESPKQKTKKELEKSDDDEKSPVKKKSPAKANGDNEKSPKKSPTTATKQEKSPVKPMQMFGVQSSSAAVKGWNNDYDPTIAKYHPIDDASWKRGEPTPYLALAKTLEKIEETSSRLKIIEILANYFRSVILLSPKDLRFSVYLCLNKLAPAYEGVELGMAEGGIMKAIGQATGRPLAKIKEDAVARGDLGLVAEESRSSQKILFQPSPLKVAGVFTKLKEIALLTGHSSQQKKISMIHSMLVACKYSEARYLVRSLVGKLRIGLAEQSVLQAIAQACYFTRPNQNQTDSSIPWPPEDDLIRAGKGLAPDALKGAIEEIASTVKACFCECPNYDVLIDALLSDGIDNLKEHCQLRPGVPPRPMLAQPTKGVDDVLKRFTGVKFTCEYKYDGERAQIHLLPDGTIQIYSRNQENNTNKYPDIVARFKACLSPEVKSCIVDSEAVAWDQENQTILPFQVLSTRKRKDAKEDEIKVQVMLFAFDLIYLNDQNMIKEPLSKRRELLREHFKIVPEQFGFATSLDTESMEEVQEFLDESIKGNCEGLMVKTLDVKSTYELAKRSQKWLKLKKDYLESGGDSLDLVVIGGFLGKGKRTGGYGGFLLACYDAENEAYQTICKLGTGFSDEQLEQHSTTLKPLVIPKPKPYYQFHNNLTPDHWFEPVHVWEIKCADLSLSPVHKAAAGIEDEERGISLRFPRFIRIREDKNVEDATTAPEVAALYRNQQQVKNQQASTAANEDEDDY